MFVYVMGESGRGLHTVPKFCMLNLAVTSYSGFLPAAVPCREALPATLDPYSKIINLR